MDRANGPVLNGIQLETGKAVQRQHTRSGSKAGGVAKVKGEVHEQSERWSTTRTNVASRTSGSHRPAAWTTRVFTVRRRDTQLLVIDALIFRRKWGWIEAGGRGRGVFLLPGLNESQPPRHSLLSLLCPPLSPGPPSLRSPHRRLSLPFSKYYVCRQHFPFPAVSASAFVFGPFVMQTIVHWPCFFDGRHWSMVRHSCHIFAVKRK